MREICTSGSMRRGVETELRLSHFKAPPDERGGNRHAQPNATAPHLDSTHSCHCRWRCAWNGRNPTRRGSSRIANWDAIGLARLPAPHLVGRLIFPQSDVDGVGRSNPSAVHVKYVISATSCGSTQCTRERTSGDPKRVLRGGGTLRGEVGRPSGSRRRRRSASTLSGIPVPTRPA